MVGQGPSGSRKIRETKLSSDRLGKFFLGPNDRNQGIYVGDAKLLGEMIPSQSVSLIVCDPVYWNMDQYA